MPEPKRNDPGMRSRILRRPHIQRNVPHGVEPDCRLVRSGEPKSKLTDLQTNVPLRLVVNKEKGARLTPGEIVALEWYVRVVRELVPDSEQYNTELHQLAENGDVKNFERMYLEHSSDTKWIKRQRQYAAADSAFEGRYNDMVAREMTNRHFKEGRR